MFTLCITVQGTATLTHPLALPPRQTAPSRYRDQLRSKVLRLRRGLMGEKKHQI